MGRLSPSNVHETFQDIYASVNKTVKAHVHPPVLPDDARH
jgi:hypothetical protein